MTSTLSEVVSSVDFSFALVRADGREYRFERGSSRLQTSYESASTSKLVTAVVIMRLVEQGYLALNDRPQDHISDWPIDSTDTLYDISLAQLLSFTSGLTNEPLCINFPGFDFEDCVGNIANSNSGNGIVPGEAFYYSGTHMQVAGLMAINALGVNAWADVFSIFKTETGLFASSEYDLPSLTNPRLAGGMHWTGEEHLAFLGAFSNGLLLSSNAMSEMLTDHTATTEISFSPALSGLGEQWHYGFGLWHECENATFDCEAGSRISSPGAYGAYPFWDRAEGYYGIVARQGALGTYTEGVTIERAVRASVDEWAACL
ncbi:MAG: beta-lactamase family protein [Agarilytica sp.]